MKEVIKFKIIILIMLAIFSGLSFGQISQLITYQGILIDPATGDPVADDIYEIEFSIYETPSAGTTIRSETKNVPTENSLYHVMLENFNLLTSTVLSGQEKYPGIKIRVDPEISPRKRIVSVAYVIMSEDADKPDGKHADAFANSSHVHDDRYYTEFEIHTSDSYPPNPNNK